MLNSDLPHDLDGVFHEQMIAFVRAFGLHQPDQTPCGESIPVAEAHALSEIARGEPLSQHDLVRRLRLEKSSVSRLVGNLVNRAWVERSRDPHDGRAVQLRLTEQGKQAAAQLAATRRAKFSRVLAALPEDQREPVIESLKLLVEALREHP
jgi:DNA-binding MarR family transcriptional regulator